jgi:tetratricopeptide (TPR) repeat protein
MADAPGLKTRPTGAGRTFGSGVMVAGAAICLAAAVALHANEDRWSPPAAVDQPELLYVRSPAVARRVALDHRGVGSDVYWIRALQHFGQERLSPPSHVRTYALLYPLLDLTTTLDPYFSIAYRFGAIFLGEPYPGGPGRPDLAIALLNKGLAAQPAKWQYMQDLGFVYYWHLRDYRAAAQMFERAAAIPGAPNWLRPLAAVTLAEGGNRTASRALWQQLAQADEDWLRDSARLRLSQLDAMDIMDAWRRAVAEGRHPALPLDPSGTPFALDPATGNITVARDSKLFPLPGQLQPPQ